MAEILTINAGGDANRSYLIACLDEESAWCVDPSYGAVRILEACRRTGCRLQEIFLTHTHTDHTASLPLLRKETGARVWVHPAEAETVRGATSLPGEGPLEEVAGIEVIPTPGHSPGSVCYRWGDALFTGDTLFVDWVGRCDLPGGNPEALFRSLAKLRSLSPDLVIHPGHNYGRTEKSTLGEEDTRNRFLACTEYDAFLALLPELE